MESAEQLKARIEAAKPGIRLELLLNGSSSAQHSLLLQKEDALAVAEFLRDDPALRFDYASNVTGVDWPDTVSKKVIKVKQVVDGVPMPQAARIVRDEAAPGGVARDEHGNCLGGLRSPWVDVPSARFEPKCTCNMVTGAMEPFPPDKMERLYGSDDGFRKQFAARVDELVAERWLLPDDGEALKIDPN